MGGCILVAFRVDRTFIGCEGDASDFHQVVRPNA